jgi:tRNA threonylcarbamoyl adenosine modification protein YeaZ
MACILTLDAALARCSAAVIRDGLVVAARQSARAYGETDPLPEMLTQVLHDAAIAPVELDAIGVTLGPGSFTGIRGALALAHGLGLGAGVAVVGVTVGEAIAADLPRAQGRTVWVAVHNQRGRVFIEQDGMVAAWPEDALPPTTGEMAIAGDACAAVAARLAAKGIDVMLTDVLYPTPMGIAAAAVERMAGRLPARAAQPLYVDPPAVSRPKHDPRLPPVA